MLLYNIAMSGLPSGTGRLDLLSASYSDGGLGRDGLAHAAALASNEFLIHCVWISNQQTASIFTFSIVCQTESCYVSWLLEGTIAY